MAYSASDTILDDEYNNFLNNSSSPFGINHIGGTGSAQYGLGESAVSTVSAGNAINASEWNALFAAMDIVAGHTATSLTSTASRSAGDSIAIVSALVSDLASLASAVAGGSTGTAAITTSGTLQTGSSSSTWYGSFTTTMTINFANADKMRHFFNAGGKIRVHAARTGNGATGGGATGKDNSWTAIYAALGNLDIKSQTSSRSGTGETFTDNLARGFHDLTTSHQNICTVADDTYPYTANTMEITAKLNAAVGSATSMEIKMIATDGAADTTFDGNSADATAYRNGSHQHYLKSVDTTSANLTNAHAPSGSTVSASTS